MNETPPSGAAAESARPPSPSRPAAPRPAASVARAIQHAPPHVTIPAAVLDCLVAGGLLALLWGHRLDSIGERILALVGLLAVAGVRVADVARAIRGGGPPTGAGPTLVLLATAQAAGHYVATAWRVAALGALVLALTVSGCASGPRTTDATVKTVLSVATLARDTACGPMLDGYLGRPQPVSLDAPAGTVVEVTQRIRDWLCGDTLAGLLDLARDLTTDLTRTRAPSAPPSAPSSVTRASPTPNASPPPTTPPEPAAAEVDAPPPVTP